MKECRLTGGYYEMGWQYGALLRRAGFSPGEASEEQLRFSRECEAVVREHAPELLDELRGVADGGRFDPELIKVLPLTLPDPGCSVVAVSGEHTANGKPLFGRNYDFFRFFAEYGELYRTLPEERLSHIGCSDHYVGRHDGINEAGLAIGHSGPPARERRPGFLFTLAIRYVLDNCRTVEEASSLLERVPHVQNSAFLVADATGEIAAVDVSPEKATTTRFTEGFGFLANRFVSGEMRAYEPEERVPNDETRVRNFRSWFEACAPLDEKDVQRVLSDPEGGVCARPEGNDQNPHADATLWSWTAVPGEPGVRLTKGTPSETAYEPVSP
jgi:predicted choloylglycine hydrolase